MCAPLHRRVGAEVPIERGRLLDVGCGPGRLDRLLAASSPDLEVVGLDASPEMIEQAGRGPALPNLSFRVGTAEDSPFHEEFDFAIAVLTFHHWDDPVAGLTGVHRALKPGGRFWIFEGNPDAPGAENAHAGTTAATHQTNAAVASADDPAADQGGCSIAHAANTGSRTGVAGGTWLASLCAAVALVLRRRRERSR